MGWIGRMRTLWNREKHSSDLDEELEFHLAMREKWNAEHGMGNDEARVNASQRFGNRTRWKEMMDDIDVFTFPETVWQDIRFAARDGADVHHLRVILGVDTSLQESTVNSQIVVHGSWADEITVSSFATEAARVGPHWYTAFFDFSSASI